MKIIIPAKTSSIRVKNKNFREFYQRESLVDILVNKLLKVVGPNDIYLSTDSEEIKTYCENKGINYTHRSPKFCDNDTPISDVVKEIVKSIPGEDDIAWCCVTDPLFDEFENVFERWRINKQQYDSLAVIYEEPSYVLSNNFEFLNFGIGKSHVSTQKIKPFYFLHNTIFISKRKEINKNSYYFGENNYWYISNEFSIDIDTEAQFRAAQLIYEDNEKERIIN
ncbi:Acylneuraminate cytidylyltransferase [Lactococcus lactis subsp. lactis]|uniref:cytidylyltransferase domain-containing protein n=1 Tax=Lactococcus lactis TaxID=1358 RepID=UPI00071CE1EE|nr:hypothetical protein [Lactococcus lactis]KST91474.1 Acylneuraminate cytidylyltransferase [Lactococcus lactis subsp. lactis]